MVQDNAALALVIEEAKPDGFDLSPKVRQFAELYVSDPEIAGNATKCYGRVFGTDVSDPNSREYGYASNKASELVNNAEVEKYVEALKKEGTRKAERRIHQQVQRAVTIVVATMEGEIRSRLQFDAAVKVLELNGITPIERTEHDIGSRMDRLIRDLAAKRRSPYVRPGVSEKVLPVSVEVGGEGGRGEDGPTQR